MLKTNENKIVEVLVQWQPMPASKRQSISYTGHDGKPFNLPGVGGITLNLEIGDSAFGYQGDHLEPGVSCSGNPGKQTEFPNPTLQYFSCSGNKAVILSGKAKGKIGRVIGHHGGAENLIVDFPRKVKEKMTYDDKIMIHTHGQGLKLIDYPTIKLTSVSPELLSKMKIKELKNGKLGIPVTTIVPAECMGSGLGSIDSYTGDYDIMTSDHASVQKYKIDQLRFGDFVAILDHENSFGPSFKRGAITIGIIIHSDSFFAGHGPGVTTLFSCAHSEIEPIVERSANIGSLFKIGKFGKKGN